MDAPIRVGLYGTNGHQVTALLPGHPDVALAAVAAFGNAALPPELAGARRCDTLDELLQDPAIDLVVLCSPRRRDQAQDTLRCLRAGKHVYAEKPCAMTEPELDAILATARETGRHFHEMAGTLVDRPYGRMRDVVQSGAIGNVVQVLSQKCYPWHDRRPADEDVDGGLALQVGIYAARFAEHIAGMRIASIALRETTLGNPDPHSACRRAASFLMTFENGGVGSAVCNYLNPIQPRCWGYEILRIFGTGGIVEANAETDTARLLIPGREPEFLDLAGWPRSYFNLFLDALLGRAPMPLAPEDEVRPTRWVLRAKAGRQPTSEGQT